MNTIRIGSIFPALCAILSTGAAIGSEPVPYGVVTDATRSEYDMHEDILDLASMGGIGYVRVDWDWRACQPSKDSPIDFSRYDKFVDAADKRGLKTLPIVYGPAEWAYPAWQHADAFAAFCRATVHHYGKRMPVLEIWNEENIPGFWKDPNPTNYVSLLRSAYKAVKEENPEIRVAFGGTAGWAHGFIEQCYRLGAKDCFDIMNVHPYTYPYPVESSHAGALRELREIMSRYGDGTKPIWYTEIGWPTHVGDITDPGNFLIAGLRTALDAKRPWKIIVAAAVSDSAAIDRAQASRLKESIPEGSEVRIAGPRETVRLLKEGGWDAVIYPHDESFPGDTISAAYDFVKAGGTLVDLGGMPFWKSYYNLPNGGSRTRPGPYDWNLYRKFHVYCDSWWIGDSKLPKNEMITVYATPEGLAAGVKQAPTGFTCGHFFSARALSPGDRFIPLVSGKNRLNDEDAVAVGVYKLNSDLKGNLVIGGISTHSSAQPVDEHTQASRLVCAMGYSFASGIDGFFYYSLRAREKDRFYSEDHFGIVHANLVPKPAWLAYRNFAFARPVGSVQLKDAWEGKDGLYYPQWKRPDGLVGGMVWKNGKDDTTLTFDGPNVTFVDMMGKPVAARKVKDCVWRTTLSPDPIYFKGARLTACTE